MEIAWSNGNLISGSVTSTQASAEVTRNGEDVTGEYAASAFAWKRDSGNAGADNTWNAAHAGKKAITLTAADLSGAVFADCDLNGAIFDRTVLEKADFSTARNYSIDPETNRIRRARFSISGLPGLLGRYDIDISET